MALSAHVVGWGSYLPQHRVPNSELEGRLDTSDEWIRERTGIGERRLAEDGESTATMAVEAAKQALQIAGISPRRVDLIIVATISPEYVFPATACLVQDAIGATSAAAFDISAGCTGFVYGLSLADQAIRSGSANTVLVVGAETLSRFVDWQDRRTCVLFGDGAGAVLLQGSDVPGGIVATHLGADGSGAELLYVPAGGARRPASEETLSRREHYLQMDGPEVYRFAVKTMAQATREVLTKAGLSLGDVSLVVPHQANARITAAAAKSLGLDAARIVETVEWCGNTSAASIPIALCHAMLQGRIQEGDLLVLVGFGAGLTWGAVALRWDRVNVAPPTWWQRRRHSAKYRLIAARSRIRRFWWRLSSFLSRQLWEGNHRGDR